MFKTSVHIFIFQIFNMGSLVKYTTSSVKGGAHVLKLSNYTVKGGAHALKCQPIL
jgi:hypothetical protein